MYIIEYIIKKFTRKKEQSTYNPVSEAEVKNYDDCEHIYMPVDSIGEILSCTKCGTLCKKSELKSELKGELQRELQRELKGRNFFMQND